MVYRETLSDIRVRIYNLGPSGSLNYFFSIVLVPDQYYFPSISNFIQMLPIFGRCAVRTPLPERRCAYKIVVSYVSDFCVMCAKSIVCWRQKKIAVRLVLVLVC